MAQFESTSNFLNVYLEYNLYLEIIGYEANQLFNSNHVNDYVYNKLHKQKTVSSKYIKHYLENNNIDQDKYEKHNWKIYNALLKKIERSKKIKKLKRKNQS